MYTALASPITLFSSGWDDSVSSVTIPFNFNFNGTNYTSCSVNSNGYITFGSTASATTDFLPISQSTGYAGAVSGFGRDLVSNASTVVRGIEGASPNRVFVIQWNNAMRYNYSGDVINFQIRLHESSNVISIRYGANSATSTANNAKAEVGLRGAMNSDYNNRSGMDNTAWNSLTTGNINNANVNFKGTVLPANGLTFTFTPLPVCSGAPAASTTVSSANPVCAGTNFVLSLGTTYAVSGITYQWESANDLAFSSGLTTLGTASTQTTSQTSSKYYRCKITCSGNTTISTAIQVTSSICYCNSTGDAYADGITGVVLNSINNVGTSSNTAYNSYTAMNTNLVLGATYPLNIYVNTAGAYTNHQSVWIDWNRDGDFVDAGEFYNAGTATNVANGLSSLCPLSITVPAGASLGATRMRIQSKYNSATTSSCEMGFDGEVEDYTITIIAGSPCVTPTAQPTSLVLTPSSASQINGSFAAASPAPSNYLVVRSLLATPPTLVNGTNYTIGTTIGTNYTVVDNDSNTTFSATGLSGSTLYYFYIYSFSAACSGGPLYYTTSPLTGNASTLAVTYCIPTVAIPSTLFIRNIKFQGTLNDVSNTSTSSSSPSGYQDFTGNPKAVQAQGEGINIATEGNSSGNWRVWVDWNKDGTFSTSEQVYTNGIYTGQTTEFGFQIPISTAPGDYRIRFRIRNTATTYTACDNFSGSVYGETEDYLFTVVSSCSAIITNVTDGVTCGSGPVTLNVSGSGSPSEYRWYSTKIGNTLVGTSATGTWTTPTLTSTATYYVTAFNGCESVERTAIVARVNPTPNLNLSNPAPVVCGENDIVSITASGDVEEVTIFNEKFDSGLGVFSYIDNDANNATTDNLTKWRNVTSVYTAPGPLWLPVISSGVAGNKFAFATSDLSSPASNSVNNFLELTNSVNTTGFTSLSLSLRVFYSRYLPDNNSIYGGTFYRDDLTIEVFDGTNWTTVQNYAEDIGFGTAFKTLTFDLTAFTNKTNLKVRVNYFSSSTSTLYFPGGVAVDDIKLSGTRPLNTAFSWTSSTPVNVFTDTACTVPYNAALGASSVFIKPDLTQLETANYNIVVSAILSNGCVASKTISVTNNTKLWSGGASTDWMSPTNWKPNGVPTADNCIVINGNTIISGSSATAFGKNMVVKSLGNINVNSGNSLTIKDALTVQAGGIFTLENNASLVQEGLTNTNTGAINVKRTAKPMKRYDFTYWSSPVSPQTLFNLSPGTLPDKYYSWNPDSQSWLIHYNGSENMVSGKGYIVRAPQSFPIDVVSSTDFVGTFTGTPNSGDITIGVKGNASSVPADYKWNLIGNPYPSAIKIDEFLTDSFNSSKINGTIYLWTHNSPPNNAIPGDAIYNYTANDYAAYNGVGGTATSAATPDPLHPVINPSPNTNVPNGFVASGQSFFIRGLADATVKFTNDMREKHDNNQFFRISNAVQNNSDKSRFWLNLRNNQGAFHQALVGYLNGATNGLDNEFDGELFGGNFASIYSLNSNKNLTIQGRALPFEVSDIVPLGINTTIAGTFSISLDNFDGLFDNQNIFLKDKLLNIVHDLKSGGYEFTTLVGTFNERFEVIYQNETLGTDNPIADVNQIIVYKKDKNVIVNAGKLNLETVKVFDIQGKLIHIEKNINGSQAILRSLPDVNQVLIVQVKTDEGMIVSKKILF